jgi:hypothetical protein
MKAITRDELIHLVNEARVKPRLRRELRFVPEEVTDWEDRDFIAITVKSGTEGVIVAPLQKLYVVPFQLQKRKANQFGRMEAIICDICATWQRGSSSATITFPKDTGSVSYLCCADLLCSLHVRDETPESILSRTQLREYTTIENRIIRLKNHLQNIFDDLV